MWSRARRQAVSGAGHLQLRRLQSRSLQRAAARARTTAPYPGYPRYLLCYKFFFRGLLLFSMEEVIGVELALAGTTALYVFAHLHKHHAETAACLGMGLVFEGTALGDGAIWSPWLLHWAIAVAAETGAAWANPDIRWRAVRES